MLVELRGEDVVDEAVGWKALGARMPLRLQFRPESRRSFAPVRPRETEELTRAEVPRMRCDEIQEMRFLRGIAEGRQRLDMGRSQAHRAKTPALSSCSSRMRRIRGASSRGLLRAKPAWAFS